MYAALVLLAITLVINIIGEFMLHRASEALGGLQK
jgi:ABC-type phosphate transport system permease subunit